MENDEKNFEILSQWKEPATEAYGLATGGKQKYLWIGLGATAILLIVIGVLTHDINYYLGAGVLISAIFALVAQIRKPGASLDIAITNAGVAIGNKTYSLDDISGFWLNSASQYIAINLELKKRTALPITFLYPTDNASEARNLLLEILPELEPRQSDITDGLSRWIRL